MGGYHFPFLDLIFFFFLFSFQCSSIMGIEFSVQNITHELGPTVSQKHFLFSISGIPGSCNLSSKTNCPLIRVRSEWAKEASSEEVRTYKVYIYPAFYFTSETVKRLGVPC